MRLALEWLHDHCDPGLDAAALAERLAMTGTEVARVLRHGVGDPEHFVVGRVLSAEPHPDADRLRVCVVAVGEGDTARIVCGAPNVATGQTVAIAQPGAVMPDGTRLGKAKLRGIVSEGMILAEDELAIGTDHDGILVLVDDGLVPGTALADVLPIATEVLELEITPNRPDCLGVYGLAREVHAATGAPLGAPPWAADPGSSGEIEGVGVEVEVPELCPRFTARAFDDVSVGPSPPWLKARLMAAGQRPISNVVDITNYVMLLTGQPLHAFDLDRVAEGRLIVRRAGEAEVVETLDGARRELDPDVVIICDEDGPTSIAGLMGGARSEVGPDTARVLMEAATWDGPNIQRSSTRLGLRSEASARFEKQLSPEAALEAQAVAARMMVELCGASLLPGTIDVGGPGPEPPAVALREARVAGLLGASVSRERCAEILGALGFGVTVGGDGLEAAVPHFRRLDVSREVDLIEEVARIDGLERLPATLPARTTLGGLSAVQRLRRRAADALAGAGVFEIVGWSFTDPEVAARLSLSDEDRRSRGVRLANPLSEAQSRLRTMLLGSLLDAARHNAAHGHPDVRLWEEGHIYLAAEGAGLPDERSHLGVLLTGPARPPSWRDAAPPGADVFAAKGVLAAVLDALRVPWSVEPGAEPFLHPGRAAHVLVEGELVGWLGEVHPSVAAEWELAGAAAGFEIELDAVLAAAQLTPRYRDVAAFPALRQDLAVVVAGDVPSARVVEIVREAAGPTLAEVEVFDVYRGEQAGEGNVSLALALAFRAPDRTLTDAEVAPAREAVERALSERLGATLRV